MLGFRRLERARHYVETVADRGGVAVLEPDWRTPGTPPVVPAEFAAVRPLGPSRAGGGGGSPSSFRPAVTDFPVMLFTTNGVLDLEGFLRFTGASPSGNVATDSIWDAKGDLAVGTGPDAASRLAVGTNGFVLTADSAQATGVKWAAGSSALASARVSRATAIGGDITVNNITTYAEVAAATGGPGTGGLDLTVAAATNDVLLVTGTFRYNNSTAVGVSLDVATWVSGAAVNWLGQTGGSGNYGLCIKPSAQLGDDGFATQYVVQAGDISGGNVTLRLMYRTTAATNRVLGRSAANGPLDFAVVNLLH